jgi:two-component system, OmpR family, alkaline phosphatase synthesis response regulator PhoP
MNKDITIKPAKILLVDDNLRVRSFVRPALEDAGFACIESADGWSALGKIAEEQPDLIVLDIMLGDDVMSGLDVCKKIRQDGITTPVIFLTIKDRSDGSHYLERAFQLGADDYVTKREELRQLEQRMGLSPTEFIGRKSDIEELVARIKARLCLQEPELEFNGYLKIDLKNHLVFIKRESQWQETHLTPAEFAILNTLIKTAGRPVGKTQIMDIAKIDGEGSLQNHIWRLRSKIEKTPEVPDYILTYHGIGYRFKDTNRRSNG